MIAYFLLTLSLIALAILGWRYLILRRRIKDYISTLHHAAAQDSPLSALPSDVKGVEDLSNIVKTLISTADSQLTIVDSDRARLAAVLDQMADGVLIADADGQVMLINPAAERLFDAQRKAALGHSVTEVLRHHQLVETWQRARQSGELQSESVELPAKRQFLHLIAIPDRHSPGGSLLLVQDLTHLRRLETVRRDFVSNLSHELRTPLASLKALTETLQSGALEDPPAARRFLGRIETEVDTLSQMAQEVLDLSRIESGQVALELRPIPPEKLLQSSAERMRLQAERAGLSLRVECPAALPKVQGDPVRLEQVLVNLIHNAVKFTPPGGEIVLSACTQGETVVFSVRDTGVGIPADDLPRIFERFYKADRARSGSGTGLGLSISRHIVEAHGGRIWAESREGQGSTFYFTIPVNRE
jgi:two-component system phosphate regulon sensor histidine kinase PhoR